MPWRWSTATTATSSSSTAPPPTPRSPPTRTSAPWRRCGAPSTSPSASPTTRRAGPSPPRRERPALRGDPPRRGGPGAEVPGGRRRARGAPRHPGPHRADLGRRLRPRPRSGYLPDVRIPVIRITGFREAGASRRSGHRGALGLEVLREEERVHQGVPVLPVDELVLPLPPVEDEPGLLEQPDARLVECEDLRVELVEVRGAEAVPAERPQRVEAVALAPRHLVPDVDGDLGAAVLPVDVGEADDADQLPRLVLDGEHDRVLVVVERRIPPLLVLETQEAELPRARADLRVVPPVA